LTLKTVGLWHSGVFAEFADRAYLSKIVIFDELFASPQCCKHKRAKHEVTAYLGFFSWAKHEDAIRASKDGPVNALRHSNKTIQHCRHEHGFRLTKDKISVLVV